jgi:hypothetical protein
VCLRSTIEPGVVGLDKDIENEQNAQNGGDLLDPQTPGGQSGNGTPEGGGKAQKEEEDPDICEDTFEDGTRYRGLKNEEGRRQGKGMFFFASGLIAYEGNWSNDKKSGIGREYSAEVGSLRASFDFKSFKTLANNWVSYDGEFQNGLRHGPGTLVLTNGERFVGSWENGLVNGDGEVYRANGTVWKAAWAADELDPTCPDEFGNLTETFTDANGVEFRYVG